MPLLLCRAETLREVRLLAHLFLCVSGSLAMQPWSCHIVHLISEIQQTEPAAVILAVQTSNDLPVYHWNCR